MLTVDSNALELAASLEGVVDQAQTDADEAAAALALSLVDPQTPRRTGRLAAGLRSVVASAGGFAITSTQPYGSVVDARTGFATRTLIAADARITALYDQALQTRFDTL